MEERWWTKETVAVVTGAQRGIGYAIARRLAGNGIQVILIDRDGEGGTAAVKALNDAGLHNVAVYQVDVQDGMAINEFANWVKQHYGKLDILVNNAGILGIEIDYDIMKARGVDPRQIFSGNIVEGISENYEMAKACIDINYYGTLENVEALLPLLKLSGDAGGRIVNVASRAGLLETFPSETLRQELNDLDNLTENKVDKFIKNFLMDFEQGLLKTNGWPLRLSAYRVSKAAIIAYTRILAREHADMYVNCVHPGYVRTDITFNTGVYSIDEGAEGPVMLALLPPGSPSGQYYNKKEIASIYFLHK
uniref:(+)-neomenthol dehydrogenase n=1 Tax=Araucaria cunninghamii TaxID=56994 RepID=A0A0D6R346_ARACU